MVGVTIGEFVAGLFFVCLALVIGAMIVLDVRDHMAKRRARNQPKREYPRATVRMIDGTAPYEPRPTYDWPDQRRDS